MKPKQSDVVSASEIAAWAWYVSRIDTRIVLIDGPTLAQLMIDHGLGVSPVETYEVKRLDLDYFTDGE